MRRGSSTHNNTRAAAHPTPLSLLGHTRQHQHRGSPLLPPSWLKVTAGMHSASIIEKRSNGNPTAECKIPMSLLRPFALCQQNHGSKSRIGCTTHSTGASSIREQQPLRSSASCALRSHPLWEFEGVTFFCSRCVFTRSHHHGEPPRAHHCASVGARRGHRCQGIHGRLCSWRCKYVPLYACYTVAMLRVPGQMWLRLVGGKPSWALCVPLRHLAHVFLYCPRRWQGWRRSSSSPHWHDGGA